MTAKTDGSGEPAYLLSKRVPLPGAAHCASWTDDSAYFAIACETGFSLLFDKKVFLLLCRWTSRFSFLLLISLVILQGVLVKAFPAVDYSPATFDPNQPLEDLAVRSVRLLRHDRILYLAMAQHRKFAMVCKIDLDNLHKEALRQVFVPPKKRLATADHPFPVFLLYLLIIS